MRLLVDIASLNRGGAERQVVELASGVVAQGHDVLLVVNKRVGAYGEELDLGGVNVVELRREKRWDPRLLGDLVRIIARYQPDCCLCVNFNATLWGRVAAAIGACPVVTAEHATRVHTPALERLTNTVLGRWTFATVACARRQVDALTRAGVDPRRIEVIKNAVDAGLLRPDRELGRSFRHELGIDDDTFVVGLVAGHRREKRQDRFIAVVEEVAREVTDVTGVMVGEGPLQTQHRAIAAASSVADRLVFAGWQTSMTRVYNAFDVVVLTSDDVETFPLCLLEAQACGVPVVGMDVGGVAETFQAGRTGYLVPAGDVEAMATKIVELHADRTRRHELGLLARQDVLSRRSPSRMIDRYVKLLDAAAQAGMRGSSRSRPGGSPPPDQQRRLYTREDWFRRG